MGWGRGFPSAWFLPLAQGHGQQQPTVTAPPSALPSPSLPRAFPNPSILPVPPAQHPQPAEPPPRGAGSVRCPYSFWVKTPAFPRFFSFQFLFPIRSQKSLQILSAQLRGNTDRHLCRGSPWISPGSQEPHTGAPRFPHQPSLSFPPLPLPSLLFGFTYPAEDKKSQVFLLLHLDSVRFISHKHICRFLRFFICSLRLQ